MRQVFDQPAYQARKDKYCIYDMLEMALVGLGQPDIRYLGFFISFHDGDGTQAALKTKRILEASFAKKEQGKERHKN